MVKEVKLRGGYPSMLSGYPAVARLLARYPKIAVEVHVAGWREVAQQVATCDVDLGIAELSGVEQDDQFATQLIGRHQGHFFCRPGHPILASGRVATQALFAYPWIASHLPARLASALPCSLGRAGKIDVRTGDFVPAIRLDVPMQIADLLAGSDTLALASLAFMERDLEAGRVAVVPTGKLAFRAGYGFIYLKNRSLPPATLAYMDEVRAVEAEIAGREAALAERYGDRL